MNKKINTILLISFFLIFFTSLIALGAKRPYVCNWKTGTCSKDTYGDGDYATMEECQRKCVAATTTTTTTKGPRYDCRLGNCIPMKPDGDYASLAACQRSCVTTTTTTRPPSSNEVGGPCHPPAECSKWVWCNYCREDGKCVREQDCERCTRFECSGDKICETALNKQYYNVCVDGICKKVSTNYGTYWMEDECSNVGGRCDIGCAGYLACQGETRLVTTPDGDLGGLVTVYTCSRSPYATHNECTKPSDCGPQSSSTEQSSTISCQVCNDKQQCVKQSFKASSCTKVKSQGYTLCTNNQDCRNASLPPTENGDSENGENGNGGYYVPTCSINKFELPNHVWTGVDYEAKWSTNSDCKWGEITCKLGDKDCGNNETLSGNVTVGSINHEKSFHIKTPGVYTYQLKACYDKNNEDTCDTWEDTLGTGLDYIEVQAVNLPWWQEIIPVLPDKLQGFLRGLIS